MIKTNKKKNSILSLENVSISYGTFEAVRNVFCNFLFLIIYILFVFSLKAANILEKIFTDNIDKTRIKEAPHASLF